MNSTKKSGPQKMTDEELIQVTGGEGQLWKSIYDKYKVACATKMTKEACKAVNVCVWSKSDKRCSIGDYEVVPDGTNESL